MTFSIRHVRAEDAQAIFEIFSGMHVVRGTMRLPHLNYDEIPKRIAPAEGTIQLVAVAEDKAIGFIELITHPGLFRHKHAGELNMIAVHENWQGKGVAKALIGEIVEMADKWLNLRRLGLVVWETNADAMALYGKFGFVEEGRIRDYVFRDGEYVDAVMMGRIKT